jgi:hypothetical protein
MRVWVDVMMVGDYLLIGRVGFYWRFWCYALFLDKPIPTNGSAHWGTGSIDINHLDIKFMVGFQIVILLVLLVWYGFDRLYLFPFQRFLEQLGVASLLRIF